MNRDTSTSRTSSSMVPGLNFWSRNRQPQHQQDLEGEDRVVGTKKRRSRSKSPSKKPKRWPMSSSHTVLERVRRSSPFLRDPLGSHQGSGAGAIAHFYREDIQLGELLRAGEFSQVYQVSALPRYDHLAHSSSNNNGNAHHNRHGHPRRYSATTATTVPASIGIHNRGDGGSSVVTAIASLGLDDSQFSPEEEEEERRRICHNLSSGSAQYALKQLAPLSKKKLKRKPKQQQQFLQLHSLAAATLVLEAQFLARLNHPNIIQLRGVPLGEEAVLNEPNGFFLITDKCMETLADRIDRWKLEQQQDIDTNGHQMLQIDTKSKQFEEKIAIARDVILALHYLHERKICNMNLNPNNIGFFKSQKGYSSGEGGGETVKLFDLGHCREISEPNSNDTGNNNNKQGSKDKDKDRMGGDELSVCDLSVMLGTPIVLTNNANMMAPNTNNNQQSSTGAFRTIIPTLSMGTVPRYLAPELVCQGRYCLKSDAYSFALVFFEMLSLSLPYASYQPGQHFIKVCVQGKRPNISLYRLPPALENLIQQGWKHNYNKRLSIATMKQVLTNVRFSSKKKSKDENHDGNNMPLVTTTNTKQDRKKKSKTHKSSRVKNRTVSPSRPLDSDGTKQGMSSRGREEGKRRRGGRRPHPPNQNLAPPRDDQQQQQQPNKRRSSSLPHRTSTTDRRRSSSLPPRTSITSSPRPGLIEARSSDESARRASFLNKSERLLVSVLSPTARKRQTAKLTTKVRRQHRRSSARKVHDPGNEKNHHSITNINNGTAGNHDDNNNDHHHESTSRREPSPSRRLTEQFLSMTMLSPGARKKQTLQLTAAVRKQPTRMSL